MTRRARRLTWAKDDPFGAEQAVVERSDRGGLVAAGVALGSAPVAYRLDYELETDDGLVTRRLAVTASGEGWRRSIDLRRDGDGWHATTTTEGKAQLPAPGGDVSALGAAALDCDLGLSPLTNSMPVLRHGFLREGPRDFTMAWVSVPDLEVHAERQRYTFVGDEPDGATLVRFDSLDGSFTAEIRFDADGFVLDYPGIARRLGAQA